jgi:hypothetical protein
MIWRALRLATELLLILVVVVLSHALWSNRKDAAEVESRRALLGQLDSDDMKAVEEAAQELARQEQYSEILQAIGLQYQSYLVLRELNWGVPIKGALPRPPPQIDVIVSVLAAAGVRAQSAVEAAALSQDPGLRWAARRASRATGPQPRDSSASSNN